MSLVQSRHSQSYSGPVDLLNYKQSLLSFSLPKFVSPEAPLCVLVWNVRSQLPLLDGEHNNIYELPHKEIP